MKFIRSASRRDHGFTLIEMLVIAPIVVLAIGAFLTVIISMTGDVLSSRGANNLAYNVQDAMNRMEQDVKLSTTFLPTNSIALNTGGHQGYNNDDATNFTNVGGTSGTSLILNELVTNGNPTSTSSGIVYLQNSPNDCASTSVVRNTPMTMNVIYYIKPDPTNNNISTLWRRTIMPANYATSGIRCSAPWQQPSCAPYFNSTTTYSSNICVTNDIKLVSGVAATDFNVQYFTTASSSSPNGTASDGSATAAARSAALASSPTVAISLNASQSVAGRSISRSAVLRATRLDSNASAIASIPAATIPAVPTVNSTTTSPTNAVFSWSAVQGATGYTIQYTVNGGSVQTGFTNQNTRTYTVAAPYNGSVVAASVTAINTAGNSGPGTNSVTIPLWVPLLLGNNWVYYSAPYAVPAYTKTSAGTVFLKGLIKAGSIGGGIATLPAGYRPATNEDLLLQNDSNSAVGRLDITSSGLINESVGSNAWVSLDGISFIPSGGATFTNLTTVNGWANYGSTWAPASYATDSLGRVQVRGLVRSGTITDGTVIAALPSALGTAQYSHVENDSNNGFGAVAFDINGNILAKGYSNAYQGLQWLFFPGAARATGATCTTQWCNLTLINSWVYYSAPYTTAQYTRAADGIVMLKGLIRSGANGTDIATLPTGSGLCPKERLILTVDSNAALGRVDIIPGVSTCEISTQSVSSGWVSLDGIRWIGEM